MTNYNHHKRMTKNFAKHKCYRTAVIVESILESWSKNRYPNMNRLKHLCKERGVSWSRVYGMTNYFYEKWYNPEYVIIPSTKEIVMYYLGCPMPKVHQKTYEEKLARLRLEDAFFDYCEKEDKLDWYYGLTLIELEKELDKASAWLKY